MIDVQIVNVEVAKRNREHVEKIKHEFMGLAKEVTDEYEMLLLELSNWHYS